ncbi:MAG: ribose 1,5-bisphosphate isomerase [Thermofilum sp.]
MIPESVARVADDIKAMRVRGASRIAKAAAEALLLAAREYRGGSVEDFSRYMVSVGRLLVSTRPTAVSLPNAVRYVLAALRGGFSSVEEARAAVEKRCEQLASYIDRAVERIAEIGSGVLRSGDVVLTHCNSVAAVSVLVRAQQKGRAVRVYATETRPKFQGLVTYRMLSEAGVDVTLIPDSAVRSVMREVDKVIVGADAVAANGAVVNKIGTSLIALAASERGVDFYVAAETYKFSPYTVVGELVVIEERSPSEVVEESFIRAHPRLAVRNPSFDVTAPEYITAIITEVGLIPPTAAAIVLEEVYGSGPVSGEPLLWSPEEDAAL